MDEKKRQQLEGQLSAYLDNELSKSERAEVEAFLAEYEEARELLAELRATVEIVKQLPRAKASDQMMDSLRARLERDALLGQTDFERPDEQGSISWGWRWIGAAAVIALVCATAYMMGPFSNRPASQEMKYAFREDKSTNTSEKVEKELTLGKRKAEAPPNALVAKDEMAAQPERAEAAQEAQPSAPGLAAPPPMPAPMAGSPDKQQMTLVELNFADSTSRDQAVQKLRTAAALENGSFHLADEQKTDSSGAIDADLVLPEGSDVNKVVENLTQDATSQPTGEHRLKEAGEVASARSLQANKPVVLPPQTQASQPEADSAVPTYLIRLRLSTAETAASRPAAASAPSTQP